MRRPLVLDAIRLSILSYESNDTIEGFTGRDHDDDSAKELVERLEGPLEFHSSKRDAQCMIGKYNGGIAFIFRGTKGTKDWMYNMDVIQDPLDVSNVPLRDRPRVHGGFNMQFQSLMTPLMNRAVQYNNDQRIDSTKKTFYYFGHSLGGALATIAATVFGALYPDARHVCITFGSPRVGDEKFTSSFQKYVDESVRCVNQEDPVPLVPTSCNYEHVYGLNYIDRDNKIQDSRTENRWWNLFRDTFLCCCGMAESPLDDHDTEQYEEVWEKYMGIH